MVENMPTVAAYINFDADPALAGFFRLDDPTYGLLDRNVLARGDAWADVTPYLVECSFTRGASSAGDPVLRYEAGTGSALLRNEDRRFDPTNLAGPYVTPGGRTQVEPLRVFWWQASWAGVTYDLARGLIDWRLGYDGPSTSEAKLELTDAFSVLSTPQGTTAPEGGGDRTGARVHRILSLAGWPVADRSVQSGTMTLQATTYGRDALTDLQDVTDTELGELYVDGLGRVVFRDREAALTEERSTVSQGIFGSDVASGELPYTGVDIVYERPRATVVRATREGGVQQTASSPARYPVAWEKSGLLMQTDQVAAGWARRVLGTAKDPKLRFVSLTVDPRADPKRLFPQVLGRRLGDRITVRRRPPGGGALIERDCFIRGISHDYGSGRWVTRWVLDSAITAEWLVLDDPIAGRLNRYRLSY